MTDSARRPIVVANWKMNLTSSEAVAYVGELSHELGDAPIGPEVVLAPAAPALAAVGAALAGSDLKLAAQNVSAEAHGAFTGEISAEMLVDVGCAYAIVGHSERRGLFGETSELVSRKVVALLSHSIRPIVCVGETLEEREGGRTDAVIGEQLDGSLAGLHPDHADEFVVAYEPVWAIGTGKTATPALAQEVHAFIRRQLAVRFGAASARVRIQYGGSVKPENAGSLLAEPDIDGALVGGASLYPASFASIVRHPDAA